MYAVPDHGIHFAMGRLSERYLKVSKLADSPTPRRRAIAGAVASILACVFLYLALRLALGPSDGTVWLACLAGALAAGYAAATTRWGLGVTYGVLGAVWALFEAVAVMIGVTAALVG